MNIFDKKENNTTTCSINVYERNEQEVNSDNFISVMELEIQDQLKQQERKYLVTLHSAKD